MERKNWIWTYEQLNTWAKQLTPFLGVLWFSAVVEREIEPSDQTCEHHVILQGLFRLRILWNWWSNVEMLVYFRDSDGMDFLVGCLFLVIFSSPRPEYECSSHQHQQQQQVAEKWGLRCNASWATGTFLIFTFYYTNFYLGLDLQLQQPPLIPSQNHKKGHK